MIILLKSLLLLIFCVVYRIHPDYFVMSHVAWSSAMIAMVYLNEDKPWRHAYHKWTADSALLGYAVLIYLVVFHVIMLNEWVGF